MKQRRGKRGERDDAEQQKGGAGVDETVKRVRRVDRGIGDGGARRRQDARNMRGGKPGQARLDFVASRPLAGGDQRDGEDGTEHHARFRAEPSLLDGILDEEEATEGERDAAEPDRPLRAETLFPTDLGFRRRKRRQRNFDRCLLRWGLRLRFGFMVSGSGPACDCWRRRRSAGRAAKRRDLGFKAGNPPFQHPQAIPRLRSRTRERQWRRRESREPEESATAIHP